MKLECCHSRKSGQSIVEFIMVVPLFLMICFFIISVSLMLHTKMLVVSSASQGARVAAQIWLDDNYSQSQVDKKVKTIAYGVLSSGGLNDNRSITVKEQGNSIYVTVGYRFKFILPLIAEFISGNEVLIKHTAVYVIEGG